MTKLDYKLDMMSNECEKAERMKNTNGDKSSAHPAAWRW